MENVQGQFKERRDDLYARHRLTKTPEDKQRVIRDMQRFNMEARKYPGVIPPITATSPRQTALQKPENPFMAFGKMTELARKGVARFDRFFQDAVIEGFTHLMIGRERLSGLMITGRNDAPPIQYIKSISKHFP
jgi:hypothetical protein